MPIYEFKCLKCNKAFEMLQMGSEDKECKCPHCGGPDFERIMSTTNFAVSSGGGGKKGVSVENRSCSSGSCTTWDIPGPK